jgi:hypothetical protein
MIQVAIRELEELEGKIVVVCGHLAEVDARGISFDLLSHLGAEREGDRGIKEV